VGITQLREGAKEIVALRLGATNHMQDTQFSTDELSRYSRHLILPNVGMGGQKKLKQSSVLVIGAGGLGSPVALYLAAAGVGTIGIVDFDTVELSNLQRQILHSTKNVGKSKLDSARERIGEFNPNIVLKTFATQLTSENALEILKDFDVIVDGTDNFPTRYLTNDACVILKKPNIYGSIFRFEGQASVFYSTQGPCYRCLYPEPPPPELVPNCAEGGVLGVLPGIIGTIQANEAIKLILGIGEPLIGRLLLFDALKMQFREMRLKKNPDCPVCGTKPTITALIDYDEFCGVKKPNAKGNESMIPEISVEELKKKMDGKEDFVLVDVRRPDESAFVSIGGTLITLNELPGKFSQLDPNKETIVYCRSGARSANATAFLMQNGFKNVKNLEGGILAWADRIDRSKPKY
jgi:adenylyltransferase/sulfurtransferase